MLLFIVGTRQCNLTQWIDTIYGNTIVVDSALFAEILGLSGKLLKLTITLQILL